MSKVKVKAVTLVELLVVIAIITVLAGLIFAVFSRAEAKAQQVVCMSNLHQLAVADLMYSQDYHGYFPPFENISPGADCTAGDGTFYLSRCAPLSLHEELMPYIEDDRIWFCPNDTVAGKDVYLGTVNHLYSSYYFIGSFVSKRVNTSVDGFVAIHSKNTIFLQPPSKAWLITDSGTYGNHGEDNLHFGGRNVAFVDGHIKCISPKQ